VSSAAESLVYIVTVSSAAESLVYIVTVSSAAESLVYILCYEALCMDEGVRGAWIAGTLKMQDPLKCQ
jgi:hypothetical protein